MRDLGGMGESFFSFWCSREGLTANPSIVDKTGWDYLVEFPFFTSPTVFNIHRSAPECKVQVKATDGKDRKLSIKLSNLRRLATSKTPAFIVFIEFNGRTEADSVFIVHLDNNLIFNILKRVHEVEKKGDGDKLHKRTMTIHYDDSNLVQHKNENSFTDAFKLFIRNDYDTYVRDKISYLETVGFDKMAYSVSFSTTGIDKARKLNDLFLGLVDNIDIDNAVSSCTRFGIKEELYPTLSGKTILRIPELQPNYEGKIKFKKRGAFRKISLPAKVYSNQAIYFEGFVGNKIRIKTNCFELIQEYQENNNFKATFRYSLESDKRISFNELLDSVTAYELVRTAKDDVQLEISANGISTIRMSISGSNLPSDNGLLKALEVIKNIVSFFKINKQILISEQDVLRHASQAEQILGLVDAKPNKVTAELSFQDNPPPIDGPIACIVYISISIGDHICAFFISLLGNVTETSPREYILIAKETHISEKIVEKREDFPDEDELIDLFNEVESKYSNKYITFKIKDGMLLS